MRSKTSNGKLNQGPSSLYPTYIPVTLISTSVAPFQLNDCFAAFSGRCRVDLIPQDHSNNHRTNVCLNTLKGVYIKSIVSSMGGYII